MGRSPFVVVPRGSPVLGVILLLAAVPLQAAEPQGNDRAQQPQRSDGPPPRTGFQMSFRTGLRFPMGDATDRPGDSLGRRYAYQLPIGIDLGAKVIPNLYLGGFFNLAFGSEGSDARIEAYCDDDNDDFENDISCSTIGIDVGLRAQYHFAPDRELNPWIGYGFGFGAIYQNVNDQERGYDESSASSGFDFARLEAGIDFRKRVGIGPLIELTIGRFSRERSEVRGESTFDGAIEERALHYWLMVGGRLVILP